MNEKFSKEELRQRGFKGFLSLSELMEGDLSQIPDARGLYVVYRNSTEKPEFLAESPMKDLRPNTTVALPMLQQRWVSLAHVLFVGIAGKPKMLTARLRDRVRKLIGFMSGKEGSHFSGRVLWQLSDSSLLLVAWKETGVMDPSFARSKFLIEFKNAFGKVPYGNTDADIKR